MQGVAVKEKRIVPVTCILIWCIKSIELGGKYASFRQEPFKFSENSMWAATASSSQISMPFHSLWENMSKCREVTKNQGYSEVGLVVR